MTARLDNLEAIDSTSQQEIGQHLQPKQMILHEDVAQRASHGVETDIRPHAKRGREEPRHALPEAGHTGLWPRGSAEEEQRNADEHDEQHHILAIAYDARHGDAEEDARQRIGKHEQQQVLPMGQAGEMEQARHNDSEPQPHEHVNHEIAQRLAQHNAERAVVVLLYRHEVLEAARLAGRTGSHADA